MEVRAHEIMESCKFILNQMDKVKFNLETTDPKLSEGEGLGWSESPSGSVVYRVKIKDNKIDSIYISTPSVFGFAAIANSMVGNIFTDFPFAVESFGVNFADAAR
jgi:Ni,Fe-hydrogenase III large subunit